MRVADVQLSFPSILIALLVDGVVTAALPREMHERVQLYVLIFAIGIRSGRSSRAPCAAPRWWSAARNTCMAARVIGLSPSRIMLTHILPNVLGPVLVIGHAHARPGDHDGGDAVVPRRRPAADQPSLGTLIRIGNDFLFSGEWWITIFPGVALVLMVLSINLLGDWLRDALNPRLR